MMMLSRILINMLIVIGFTGCNNTSSPLPRGYFRIDLPEHEYRWSDTTMPFLFKYPVYCTLSPPSFESNNESWLNLAFPDHKATLYLSYKPVNNNLIEYLEDSYTLVSKHIPKAENIIDSIIVDRTRSVYGLTYKIEGSGAASPFQFFVTDSSNHFLRGALYFNIVPNNDSLEPVIDFIEKDIEKLIESLEWKNKNQ